MKYTCETCKFGSYNENTGFWECKFSNFEGREECRADYEKRED